MTSSRRAAQTEARRKALKQSRKNKNTAKIDDVNKS